MHLSPDELDFVSYHLRKYNIPAPEVVNNGIDSDRRKTISKEDARILKSKAALLGFMTDPGFEPEDPYEDDEINW